MLLHIALKLKIDVYPSSCPLTDETISSENTATPMKCFSIIFQVIFKIKHCVVIMSIMKIASLLRWPFLLEILGLGSTMLLSDMYHQS